MMDGSSRNDEDVSHNKKLLDLNKLGKEERELELRLGPPGDEQDWSKDHNENENNNNKRERDDSSQLCFKDSSSFLEVQSSTQNKSVLGKESKEKKSFSLSSPNTNVPYSSQKRTSGPGPVVGWPPISISRKNKNIASGSSSKNKGATNNDKERHVHNNASNKDKSLFVKINMDGVPIGRKVDINACGSFEKLSGVVDELFRDLLAAQRDSCGGGIQNKREEEEKVITGLLDQGNGEYTLAFEDHEGHNMLVRDVPWNTFVSTVKRLRVLKNCDLSAFSSGSKQIHTNKLRRQ